jgi:hypothetical protein
MKLWKRIRKECRKEESCAGCGYYLQKKDGFYECVFKHFSSFTSFPNQWKYPELYLRKASLLHILQKVIELKNDKGG